ncbi:hypothetical protein L1D29_17430 [Shewanella insulae]|uniref:hypothetical protein n=1 Tax=Shewanella insulae TaxID=2681496 RepID=UPI001EFE7B0E|nr:hypothetical protein [Shewanella insulae]MCG9714590.1 hypothetical protein [Shewanella insulae]
MNKMFPTALLLLSSTISGATFANFTAIECNDCSATAAEQQAAKALANQETKSIYVVDFVNYNVKKFKQDGDAVSTTTMTLSENLEVNNHYAHRKVNLRSVD